MLKTIITAAAMTILALADGPVLQTGQVKSYDADGNVVPYGTVKDDGYYRAGKARSYSRGEDVIIDNTTGMAWQDNESIQKKWTETSGDTAEAYCGKLLLYYNNAYYYGWRLPSIKELQTLVNYSQYDPAVTEDLFNHIFSNPYWSSTTNAYNTGSAWIVNFNNGYLGNYNKGYNGYVRCVRNPATIIYPIIRDDDMVFDSGTGLQWQDDTIVETALRSWTEAIDYCENTLTLGGHDDWRLPNLNELFSIVEYSQYHPAIDSVFAHTEPDYYWSSTTGTYNTSKAWSVNFYYGDSNSNLKDGNHYVRCVRGGQINKPINPSIIMYLLN